MNPTIGCNQDGHMVVSYEMDIPANVHIELQTGCLVLDSACLQLTGSDKAAILQIRMSPAIARTLLGALRAAEGVISRPTESPAGQTIQ